MKRASTMVLVALLSVLAVAAPVGATHDGTPDPQAPVHEGGKPHGDEVQAPRMA